MINFIFAVWAVADLISYYFTGADTVQQLAGLLGWVQPSAGGDTITFIWGMSFLDFLIVDWMYICCAIAAVLMTVWICLKPYDQNGKIIWSIFKAHRVNKARRLARHG